VIRIFLDANIYFSAARSLQGGSAIVLEFAKKGRVELFATSAVLKEAERNLRLKEKVLVLIRHYGNLKLAKPKIVKISGRRAKEKLKLIINEKDALILAGAEKAKADYLVTLDKKHFFAEKVGLAKLPFEIITPGHLIERLVADLRNSSR